MIKYIFCYHINGAWGQYVICPITTQKKPDNTILTIHCNQCKHGQASIQNKNCRTNILTLLQNHPHITQLILHHTYIKIYQDTSLTYLKELARFQEEIQVDYSLRSTFKQKRSKQGKKASEKRQTENETIFSEFQQFKSQSSYPSSTRTQIKSKTPMLHRIPDTISSSVFFHNYIRPYIRPGFIDSFIQMQPPPGSIFESTYSVNTSSIKQATVTIYSQNDSPEKLYFLLPREYQLSQQDVTLLEKVRIKLSNHHPDTASFIDSDHARSYFTRFAKQTILSILQKSKKQTKLDSQHITQLATIFAQYTAGLGIIEDVLNDPNIQDVYVNAPVQNNPLHVVLNGDEYTTNIFLSYQDIDALSSRFRSMSGRPFSEATPVLDTHLPSFQTRIAAISQPLTPKGTAFAFRKHRKKPWTLAHFIANNMLSAEAAGLLSFLVDGQASLLIAGTRGAGKTSLLTALLLEIPQRFRILTIEDTSEIPITHLQDLGYRIQSLLTKSISSSDQSTELHPTDALRTALRLGESVLIIGEVRGIEAKVLFEAMRVGAAGNLIMGTIHGSTPIDVFERIVYDIGVPSTSFKAVDAIIVTAPIRKQGGVGRTRRVTQISETMKHSWTPTISAEQVFEDLMEFDATKDTLIQLPRITIGQSTIIQNIARRWGISVEQALENIELRTHIKKQIVKAGTAIDNSFLEAGCMRDAKNQFWMLIEQAKQNDSVDYTLIKQQWDSWFKLYVQRRTSSC